MDYNEIILAGTSYADRANDPEIVANLDLFLSFGEARLSRLLKVRKASVRAVLVMADDQEYYSLPSDFGGMRDIQIISTNDGGQVRNRTLEMMNPQQMNNQSQTSTGNNTNQLGYYTIIADQIQVWPVGNSGANLEIVYYRTIPPLTSIDSTNWVSEDHPDIYLCLLMYEIELFTKNHTIADGWTNRLDVALRELATSDDLERWSGTPLSTRVG